MTDSNMEIEHIELKNYAPFEGVDMVNHPPHYNSGGLECIDAIEASMEPKAFQGYLKGNVLKYVWRYEKKGGPQDLAKAQWYLAKLSEVVRATNDE